MNTEQLRNAILLYAYGSINRAAQKTFVSPQAFGASIRKLEAEVGYPLFEHNGTRKLVPTACGVAFVGAAKKALSEIERGMEQVRLAAGERAEPNAKRETLTVYLSTLYGERLIKFLLDRFEAVKPDVQLNLFQMNALEIVERVSRIDCLGVYITYDRPEYGDDVVCARLGSDRFYALCASSHKLASGKETNIKTVLKYPLILLQSGDVENPLDAILSQYGSPLYYSITNNIGIYWAALTGGHAVVFTTRALTDVLLDGAKDDDKIAVLPIKGFPDIDSYYAVNRRYYSEHEESISLVLDIIKTLL